MIIVEDGPRFYDVATWVMRGATLKPTVERLSHARCRQQAERTSQIVLTARPCVEIVLVMRLTEPSC